MSDAFIFTGSVPRITLEPEEIQKAALIGINRQIRAQIRGKSLPSWDANIVGAIGEFVVAKVLGIPWEDCPQFDNINGDVGSFQVRTSIWPGAHLLLYPSDNDDAQFILVTGLTPTFTIRGWIMGRDGKNSQYWDETKTKAPKPCWAIPQCDLMPLGIQFVMPSMETANA